MAVLPYAALGHPRRGASSASARALGETMAVTMVIGNAPQISRLAVRARLLAAGGDRQRVRRGHRRRPHRRARRAGAGAVRRHAAAQRRRARCWCVSAREHGASSGASGMTPSTRDRSPPACVDRAHGPRVCALRGRWPRWCRSVSRARGWWSRKGARGLSLRLLHAAAAARRRDRRRHGQRDPRHALHGRPRLR